MEMMERHVNYESSDASDDTDEGGDARRLYCDGG